MKNLKDQLAGIAALVAAVVAIGGGFATYGKLTEKINVLESKSSADYSAQIAVLEEKVAALESHEHDMAEHGHTKILVNEKQIELLQVQIEEIKVSTSNPLAN
jgi:prophage DNA circulation protein